MDDALKIAIDAIDDRRNKPWWDGSVCLNCNVKTRNLTAAQRELLVQHYRDCGTVFMLRFKPDGRKT